MINPENPTPKLKFRKPKVDNRKGGHRKCRNPECNNVLHPKTKTGVCADCRHSEYCECRKCIYYREKKRHEEAEERKKYLVRKNGINLMRFPWE